MRLGSIVPVIALLVSACAGVAVDTPGAAEGPQADTDIVPELVETTEPTVPERTVWEGFSATVGASSGLVAYSRGEVAVYGSPDAARPWTTIGPLTTLGTITVLAVIGEPMDGWAEVMLPIRPNGSIGWVRVDDVFLYVADSEIVVDLGERRLTYLVDGVGVMETDVGIGSDYNETPTGSFFVTDSVTLSDPNSAWGPHALGLSAHSDTITSFNGGDGIIGIHGTNNSPSIGSNISLGCLRLPNEMITLLHEMVPIGTKVEIRA